jgi:hypothetical protein
MGTLLSTVAGWVEAGVVYGVVVIGSLPLYALMLLHPPRGTRRRVRPR